MNNDDKIILSVSQQVTPLQYADELTLYIEQASCAVSVLGDMLKAVPEEELGDGVVQSLGFLLNIIGDGMMYRDEAARNYIWKTKKAASSVAVPASQPGQ